MAGAPIPRRGAQFACGEMCGSPHGRGSLKDFDTGRRGSFCRHKFSHFLIVCDRFESGGKSRRQDLRERLINRRKIWFGRPCSFSGEEERLALRFGAARSAAATKTPVAVVVDRRCPAAAPPLPSSPFPFPFVFARSFD
jgi:hypothetical protein